MLSRTLCLLVLGATLVPSAAARGNPDAPSVG
jgi:hypothetical protein